MFFELVLFSGTSAGLGHYVATEGRPGYVAAARPAGRSGMPACSPSRSPTLFP